MSFSSNDEKIIPIQIKNDKNKSIKHILKNTTNLKFINQNNNNKPLNMFNISFNQFGLINKYGILFFYDENGIYFFDSHNINNLLTEKKVENNFLFYLK